MFYLKRIIIFSHFAHFADQDKNMTQVGNKLNSLNQAVMKMSNRRSNVGHQHMYIHVRPLQSKRRMQLIKIQLTAK